ncbi:MAG: hypothetical protein HQL75_00305 [Magnetococcales bacterium]|nr:hypothetical protein [Magnetococcales bacterium]
MADPKRIQVTVGAQPIKVQLRKDVLDAKAPIVFGNGWPFGTNPNFVEGIQQGVKTLIDRVLMPGRYRLLKWLFVASDDSKGHGIACEINAFTTNVGVEYTEFAILGNVDDLSYEIFVEMNGGYVELHLIVKSDHVVKARTARIGVFN